jgi:hypothetical protein
MKAIFTTFPIAAALDRAAGKFIADLVREESNQEQSLPLAWVPTNEMQEALLAPDLWQPTVAALDHLSADELAYIASWKAEDINEFLRREKFEIQLNPWPVDHVTFGMAGMIKLLRHWVKTGEDDYTVGKWKKAFRLEDGLRFFNYGVEGETGVAIQTREGDWVHIVRAPSALSHFALIRYAMQTTVRAKHSDRYTGVILPQWEFQQKVDVTDLIGLNTTDAAKNPWRLSQALFEGKSGFGPAGMSFKAAFAAAAMRGGGPVNKPHTGDLVVDYPLVASIWRPKVQVPLGVVMVEPEDFSGTNVFIDGRNDW